MEELHKCKYGSGLMNTISDEDPQYKVKMTESHKQQIIYITEGSKNYIDPDCELAHRGTYYYKLEIYDKAIEDFKRGLSYLEKNNRSDGEIMKTLLYLGLCYLNKNNIAKSSEVFNRLYDIEIKTNEQIEGWSHLGHICKGVNYYSIGDTEKACEYFRKADRDGDIQNKIGGIICKIVQKCKCEGLRIIDEDKENQKISKMFRELDNGKSIEDIIKDMGNDL